MRLTATSRLARGMRRTVILLAGGALPLFGPIESCSQTLTGLTQYVDPCGTVFANCLPGSILANNVPIGSEAAQCLDPTCTIPGACTPGTPVLGSVRPVCKRR